MKHIYLIISLISLSLFLTSCKSDSDESTRNTNDISTDDLNDFIEFDLRPYELNASLMLPKEERASIRHQLDTYEWDVKIGKQTYLSIFDWGTKDGFEDYYERLENHPEKVDFIEKEKNFTLYTLTTGTSKVTYHTAAQHEIDGVNYLFESSKQGLSKDGVEDAVLSVKSVEALK